MEESKPTYKNSVIAYFDILGFKNHTINLTNQDEIDFSKFLMKLKHCMSTIPKELAFNNYVFLREFACFNKNPNHYYINSINFTQFSDNIAISFPTDNKHIREQLGNFIWGLCDCICHFLVQGFLVRGALEYNLLYHKDNVILGPAINNAYELESKIANYPRFILSQKLLELIDSNQNGDSQLLNILTTKYEDGLIGFDQTTFLNPSYPSSLVKGNTPITDLQRNELIKMKNSSSSNIAVSTKINWLISQYNRNLNSR